VVVDSADRTEPSAHGSSRSRPMGGTSAIEASIETVQGRLVVLVRATRAEGGRVGRSSRAGVVVVVIRLGAF
jgi:hypothetical protein